jgi:hypothetical protein
MMADLLELADACEAAEGPDRELDCAIAVSAANFFEIPPRYDGGPIGYGYHDAKGAEIHPGHGGDQMVPAYTASIDAAMTLVPEGCDVTLDREKGFGAALVFDTLGVDTIGAARATTPALALCAASLRARAATPNHEDG